MIKNLLLQNQFEEPLAKWCNADRVDQRKYKWIIAQASKETLDYCNTDYTLRLRPRFFILFRNNIVFIGNYF